MRRVQRGAFASYLLTVSGGGLSGQERSLLTDLVYGTLRYKRYLDACLAPRLKRPDKLPENVRNALRLGTYELLVRGTPRRAVVNEWVEIIKPKYGKLTGLANAVLRQVEGRDNLSPAVKTGVPDWLFKEWLELFGASALDVAQGMLEPEPLWLYNYHDNAAASLEEEGCEVRPGPLPNTFAVRPSKPLPDLEAFKHGRVQPQNPSSTVPARLLELQQGERVLDLASGNGIKTAQLAASGAEVVSVEVDAEKVKRAERNLNRLHLSATHLIHDLRTPPSIEPAPKVLLDAPCSGTGTLRGNPEIRGRVTRKDVQSLAELQRHLLKTAAGLTQPGGTLVHAVCALTKEESVDIAEWFLEAQPEFGLEPFEISLHSLETPQGTFILPVDGLDGFFIAKFKRKA